MTPERTVELYAEINHLNDALVGVETTETDLQERKRAVAREILVKSILPSLHWTVMSDGETLVADEHVGIDVLILFGARFHHERFDLTGTTVSHPDRVAHDLLTWLREKNLLAFDPGDDPAMFGLFQASQSWFTDEVLVDDKCYIWANVDDTKLTLYGLDTDRLLAFVEEHKLDVNWAEAVNTIAEAKKAAAEATVRAKDVEARLARFVRQEVQDDPCGA